MYRPKLVLLVGPPGCGKSTYAKKYAEEHVNTVHLSSDQIRAEIYGDATIQTDPSRVFALMQARAVEALNNWQNVVYDATNMTRKDRAGIIAACPKFIKIECHIIWAPIETCIERDAARNRTVGKIVIDKMLKRFQSPYYDEGIDEIKVIYPDSFIRMTYYDKVSSDMRISHDNPHHTLNVYDHCIEAQMYLYNNCNVVITEDDDILMTAALYHDIGKPYVKAFIDSKGNSCEHAHYYQHQCVGAWMSYGLCNNPHITWLISTHMDPFLSTKYYNKLPGYLKDRVDLLHEADLAAH